MDDLYQFMSPLEGAPTLNATPPLSDKDTEKGKEKDAAAATPADATTATGTSASSSTGSKRTSTWGTWGSSASSWGVSFNKLIEKGKKDMHEFVDVTRKDLNELVQTVQAESSTTIESISKTVDTLRTNLPPLPTTPLPTTAHSVDLLSRINQAGDDAAAASEATSSEEKGDKPKEGEHKEDDNNKDDESSKTIPQGETAEGEQASSANVSADARAQKTVSTQSLGTAAASLFSTSAARANTLSQSLTSSTKELSSTASSLFKKTLQPAVEKQLGEADAFFKHTAESLKTNGLMAEQYVNKLGANMANFINSAVVVSAPTESSVAPRSKKPVFDRKEAMLETLRMDPATYTTDPMTSIADNDIVGLERYRTFLQTFNIAEYQQRISRLLNEYPEVKALMSKLVPVDVEDEELFWQRYFFRLYEIEEEEKRRKRLVQAAGADPEEDLTWDDSDSEDDVEKDAKTKDGSATPKALSSSTNPTTPKPSGKDAAMTPKAATTTLTPEALASSLAALPVPSESESKSQDSDDEWGNSSSPAVTSATTSPSAATTALGATSNNKESSTRSSEENYEVVDGAATPARAPESTVLSLSSTAATSPIVDQHPTIVAPAERSKDDDDWSDWE